MNLWLDIAGGTIYLIGLAAHWRLMYIHRQYEGGEKEKAAVEAFLLSVNPLYWFVLPFITDRYKHGWRIRK